MKALRAKQKKIFGHPFSLAYVNYYTIIILFYYIILLYIHFMDKN